MKIHTYEQNTLDTVAGHFAHQNDILHTRGISATHRLSLANAAAAAAVTTDELMAVLDYRVRRAAQHPTEQVASHDEAELVA